MPLVMRTPGDPFAGPRINGRFPPFTPTSLKRVRCALKLADGADRQSPEVVARAPQGLNPRPGEVVRLRAGTDEGSCKAGPLSEVLGRVAVPPTPGATQRVACCP